MNIMNLILLLILFFKALTVGNNTFKLLGYLKRYNYKFFYFNDYCFYLNISEYNDVEEIEVKAAVYFGSFTENIMFYRESDTEFSKGQYLNFTFNMTNSSYIKGPPSGYQEYNNFTYIFDIPKPNTKFLYISFPSFKASWGEISVNYNISGSSDSSDSSSSSDTYESSSFTQVYIICIVFSLIGFIIIVIIIFYCFRKARRSRIQSNYISTPGNTYTSNLNPSAPYINSYIPNANAYPGMNTNNTTINAYSVNSYPPNVPLAKNSYDSTPIYEPPAPTANQSQPIKYV